MTFEETITIIEILAATYPNSKQFQDDENCMKTAKVWTTLLEDLDSAIVVKAIKKHCMTNKFPPVIAEIRSAVLEITVPESKLTASDAWGEVIKAVRNYGYYNEEAALKSLSETTRRVVKNIGWKDICTCEEPDVIRGQFRKAFESVSTRKREDGMLPELFGFECEQLVSGGFTMIGGVEDETD